jgi:hypothetical protein
VSYARFSHADVYVFLNTAGYMDCCGCWLDHPGEFSCTEDLLAHLKDHVAAGHFVPEDTIDGLNWDKEENDKFIRDVAAGMCSSCSGDKLCQCQHWRPPGITHRGEKCEWCKDGACPSCQGRGGSAEWAARAT